MKRIIQATQSDELIVNKSKFTGYALIGESREDFLSSINTIASQMPGSNHVAFAYQIKTNHGVDAYFNDAGEPSGTAGKPLLNILEKKNIVNVNADIAREINEDKKTQLKLMLNKALDRNSELSFNVDPKILGGIRLRVGNELIDASLANHLNKLRHKMLDAK